MNYYPTIYEGSCDEVIEQKIKPNSIDLSFLDPPFNQNKQYQKHKDNLDFEEYWNWMTRVCKLLHRRTVIDGCVYFMQREKNTEFVLKALRESGWKLQNLIIWKKMTSAVPQQLRYGKQFQIIAFATKTSSPTKFNKLRYDAPLASHMKRMRKNGLYCTDVWDDIRELTSGFFAGEEALRKETTKKRLHKQQAPLALLLRIILSSTLVGDTVLDPFAGTGTTSIVTMQLKRMGILIEQSSENLQIIKTRVQKMRKADNISKWRTYYRFTKNLDKIWHIKS